MSRDRKVLLTALLLGCVVALAGCGGADSGVGPAGASVLGQGAASDQVQPGGDSIIDSISGGYSAPAAALPVSGISDPLADPNASSTLDDTSMNDSLTTGGDPFSSLSLDDTSSDSSAMNVSLSDNLGSMDGSDGMSFDSALADSSNELSPGGDMTNPVTQAVNNLALGTDATDSLPNDPALNDPSLDDPNADPSLP